MGVSEQNFMPYSMPVSYPAQPPQAYPVSAGSVPMVAMAAATGVARWATKYPQLWQALQRIKANVSKSMTIEKLWSMLKRIGPGGLSTVIGAAAVSELIMYRTVHKRRRMNVANAKALRRGLRRLKGFDRMADRVSAQLCRTAAGRPTHRKKRC